MVIHFPNENERAEKEICKFIKSLSGERLEYLITTPPLGQDLLEHATYCSDCGKRIEEVGDAVFKALPPEEKEAVMRAAVRVKRRFEEAVAKMKKPI